MRLITGDLDVRTASLPATGSPHITRDFQVDRWVQINGPFAGSLTIEVSLDGSEFFSYITGITGPGLHKIEPPAAFVRVRTITLTSGTPKALIAGYYVDG